MLRFNRETRHVLTEDEVRATNWYLVCIGFAALCGVWGFFGKSAFLPRTIGLAALFFTSAITQVFEATPGYVRRRMAVLTLIAAAALVLTPVALIAGLVWILSTKQTGLMVPFIRGIFWVPVAVVLYSAFADNIRQHFEKQRPDEG